MPDQPNILFLMTDQQTINALSCAGNRYCNTPHLDRLARMGVRFEQSYCAAPVCGPSRAAIATGRMPHEINCDHNDPPLPDGIETFGNRLRDVGYQTFWVGKWHVPHSYPQPDLGQEARGFTTIPTPHVPDYALGASTDQIITRNAYSLITRELPKTDQPWFVTVSLHNPHDICGYVRSWGNIEHPNVDRLPPFPDNFEVPIDESAFMQRCRNREHYGDETRSTFNWTETQWRGYLHTYYRLVEAIDWQFGRVLGALEEGGYNLEDTVIVFTSDHGENCGAHRFAVKLTLYENAAKVPMIWSCPKRFQQNAVNSNHLVSGIDLAPTICDIAGAKHDDMTGRTMLGLLTDNTTAWRDYLVCELAPETENHDQKARMVRTERYKYICCCEGDKPEMLFDLHTDPGETRSLAYDDSMKQVLEQHRAHLREYIDQTNDHFQAPAEIAL